MLRTTFVVDYQNVHLTAHDVFDRYGATHESLIDPMNFARAALVERNKQQRPGWPYAELSRVLVYRGLPHVDYAWEANRRCLDQASRWRATGATVELRDLKYSYDRGADGKPMLDIRGKKLTIGRPMEKGIDVLCALACVRETVAPDIDLVVLASRDTDLVPVLDELFDLRGSDQSRYARIETVAWFDRQAARDGRYGGGSLHPTAPRKIWNTNMDRACYNASIDRTVYR